MELVSRLACRLFLIEKVKFLPWFEAHRFARSNGYFRTGTGIASDARLAGTHIEHPKPPQFDPVAGCQGFLEALKDGVYRYFRLVARESGSLDHMMDYVLFNQRIRLIGDVVAKQLSTCADARELSSHCQRVILLVRCSIL
jgi:hypothetical protein